MIYMQATETHFNINIPNDDLLTELLNCRFDNMSNDLDIKPDTDYVLMPATLWHDLVTHLPLDVFFTLVETVTNTNVGRPHAIRFTND